MEFDLLPSTVYQPSSSGQARTTLNTIIEEDQSSERSLGAGRGRGRSRWSTHRPLEIRCSLASPKSDDFPTPRAGGFLSAPPDHSPSSSVDTSSLTWTSSDTGRSADTGTDVEDLYGASDDDVAMSKGQAQMMDNAYDETDSEAESEGHIPIVIVRRLKSLHDANLSRRPSVRSGHTKRVYPSLQIPGSEEWPTPPGYEDRKKDSLIPPTPPPKIPISPAVLSLLAHDVPTSTAPPSLDGSLTSDQLAISTSPPTPSLQASEQDEPSWEGGIHLNTEALSTLQAFSTDEFQHDNEPLMSARLPETDTDRPVAPPNPRQDSTETIKPAAHRSFAGLDGLDIPSPGGFLASLPSAIRHTWAPPSSTTAEHFYKCPWNAPEAAPVERIVEVSDMDSDGPPTAKPAHPLSPMRAESSLQADEIVLPPAGPDYDEAYEKGLKDVASASLDRTSHWLHTQEAYLATLREAVDPRIFGDKDALITPQAETFPSVSDSPGSKVVRFSEDAVRATEAKCTRDGDAKEALFWLAFQQMIRTSSRVDALTHSQARFDLVQSQRTCIAGAHREQLLGKSQALAKPHTADPDEVVTISHRQLAQVQKERDALCQVSGPAWNVLAAKTLNGGRLLSRPATHRVRQQVRAMISGRGNIVRVLDLGGQSTCDWAWACAEQFPRAMVYTAADEKLRQPCSDNLQGPKNHHQVVVPQLWRLPFADNHFDVISARSLYMMLRTDKPSEEIEDEYDLCLRECMRCLKPGGFLDFTLLDSDIMHGGSRGSAMSVEFGFNLKTRGYDSTPTRNFLGRLRKAGYVGTKRSWMFLPMGAPRPEFSSTTEAGGHVNLEAAVERKQSEQGDSVGSTSAAASLTGLVGSWAWERWMLKLQMESGKAEELLLEGVGDVIEEGRNCGAGWRCLTGWSMKPTRR